MLKARRGGFLDSVILKKLELQEYPISTRELALRTKLSWHTVINHCLRLQMNGKVIGYKIGNINVWIKKK